MILKLLSLFATFLIAIFAPTTQYFIYGQEEDEDADGEQLMTIK